MNTITKRQNGNTVASFGSVFEDIFQDSLPRIFNYTFGNDNAVNSSVPVNVRETDQHYEIDVIAPGYKKENFQVKVDNRELNIAYADRNSQQEKDSAHRWVRNEYMPRPFSSNFSLDETVDLNRIEAAYRDGILQLKLFKNEKAQPLSRQITIQ